MGHRSHSTHRNRYKYPLQYKACDLKKKTFWGDDMPPRGRQICRKLKISQLLLRVTHGGRLIQHIFGLLLKQQPMRLPV